MGYHLLADRQQDAVGHVPVLPMKTTCIGGDIAADRAEDKVWTKLSRNHPVRHRLGAKGARNVRWLYIFFLLKLYDGTAVRAGPVDADHSMSSLLLRTRLQRAQKL